MDVKQCIMVPYNLEFDIEAIKGNMPILHFAFKMKCDDAFKCS